MSDANYKPVTVDAARQIAQAFQKSIVVIIAIDPVHDKLHTTTYGMGSVDKVQAARLGDLLATAAGANLQQRHTFSDFREVAAGESARAIDLLIQANDAADAALANLLGVRERLSAEMIEAAENARNTIGLAKADAVKATRGGAGGDAPG